MLQAQPSKRDVVNFTSSVPTKGLVLSSLGVFSRVKLCLPQVAGAILPAWSFPPLLSAAQPQTKFCNLLLIRHKHTNDYKADIV